MKVLLLGGTGVMGISLSQLLAQNNIDTVVTSRSSHKSVGKITYVKGNAMELEFSKQICSNCEWDAIVDFMSYKTVEFRERIDYLLNSTKQYVYISSARVYGNLEHPIKESSPRLLDCSEDEEFLHTDEYSLTKARQEDLLLKFNKKNYTIVRPCITYGDRRLQLGVMEKEEWLFRALNGRTIVFCKEIMESVTTMTTGADICMAIYKIIGNPKAIGEVYHLTSAHHRKWSEIWEIYKKAIASITGSEPKIYLASLDEFLLCRNKSLKYQVIYDRVYNRDYDTEKESTLVDVNEFTSPEDGLTTCIRNFINNPSFKYINAKNEARKDKLTHEHTPLRDFSGFRNKVNYLIERYLK